MLYSFLAITCENQKRNQVSVIEIPAASFSLQAIA
jgi:hypothetical protein